MVSNISKFIKEPRAGGKKKQALVTWGRNAGAFIGITGNAKTWNWPEHFEWCLWLYAPSCSFWRIGLQHFHDSEGIGPAHLQVLVGWPWKCTWSHLGHPKKGADIGSDQNYEVPCPALTLSSVLPLSEYSQTLPAWQDTSPSVKSSEVHWVKGKSSIISPHPASPCSHGSEERHVSPSHMHHL